MRKTKLFTVCYNSYRADAIESTTNQDFDGFIFFDPHGIRDIEVLVRYIDLLDLEQKPKVYIVANDLDVFREAMNKYINLDISLINLPMKIEDIVLVISRSFFPEKFKDANVKDCFRADTRFIRVFIDSASSVMKELLGDVSIKNSAPYFMSKALDDIAIRSHIVIDSSHFSGSFFFSMPEETYLEIYKRVVGEEFKSINDENKDFINEMANMIYGQTKAIFETLNYKFDMVLPTLFTENPLDYNQHIIVIPYDSNVGKFYIKIGLR